MSLNFHFFKKNLIDITIFILMQYIVITAILMFLYSGGNPIYPTEHVYAFDLNFLSDLGRKRYFSHQSNPFWFFYTLTMVLSGIGTVLYFYLMSRFINTPAIRNLIVSLGIIAGLGYALIGFFPVDISLSRHLTAGMTAFYTFIFANMMVTLFIKKEQYPYIFYATAFINFLLINRMLILIFINHFHLEPTEMLEIKVISQKIVVYMQVIIMSSILFYIKRKRIFYY